jgi:SAM-dependent methyltransferase
MDPRETAANYDRIAGWIQRQTGATYGVAALRRAIGFATGRGAALDVGCGPTGRFLTILEAEGFCVEGLDISAAMLALAAERNSHATFHRADICDWDFPRAYDFIAAWDSTFHLPLDRQEPVLRRLCAGLAPGGVLLFTCGGGAPGEISGEMEGLRFDYSTLGVERNVALLAECGCLVRHVEYDQWPERHVVIVAQRGGLPE